MDKFLRPERFETNPKSRSAAKEWNHRLRTFSNFMQVTEQHNPDKLNILINYLAPSAFEYIADCKSYDDVIHVLKMYAKPPNEVYARHLLASHRQQPGESLMSISKHSGN